MPYIIDGHNLIAALPDINLDDPDDEVKLVLKLRAWCAHTGRKAVVYFDGGLPGGVARDLSTSRLRVIFAAAERSSADALIKAHLQRLKDARNWTVVTSDRDILAAAYRRGAHGLKSQDFAAELTHHPPVPEEEEKPATLLGEELQHWLRAFTSSSDEKSAVTGDAPADEPAPVMASQDEQRRRHQPPQRLPQRDESTPVSGISLGELAPALRDLLGGAPTPPAVPQEEIAGHPDKPASLSPEEIEAWLKEFPELDEPIAPPPPKPAPPRPLKRGQSKPTDITQEELAEWLYRFGGDNQEKKDEDAATMERLFGPRRPRRRP